MRLPFLVSLLIFFAALDVNAQKQEIFSPGGKAINGYDVVAFFKEAKPVKGADSLVYEYKGAQWFFSSRENLDDFKKRAEYYTPQYGGYCAYGTAEGHKAPTQAETWTIVKDKLYFNYNAKVKETWMKDKSGYIEKADQQWPVVKGQR